MISSISRRLPRKTCGLFDSGIAGGDLDVTSLDLNAPADFIHRDPFALLGGQQPKNEPGHIFTIDDGQDALTSGQHESDLMADWDLLSPLADLEGDPLGDTSLDAFVNLDQFLMGNTFFDDAAEVKPVINIPASVQTDKTPASQLDFSFADSVVPEPTPFKLSPPPKTRKRKAGAKPGEAQPVATSMFVIPAPVSESVVSTTTGSQLDHDYTAKRQKMSAPSRNSHKYTSNGKPAKPTLAPCEDSNSSCSSDISNLDPAITDKVMVRRIKNNVASKRSREQRKQKFAEMDRESEELIAANEALRQKIVELERVATEMKALLVAKMTGK